MKKITFVVLFVLMLSQLVACNKGNDMPDIGKIKKYDGEKIDSISYVTIDYNGGCMRETLVDFVSNEVSIRGYMPNVTGEIPEYEPKYQFTDDKEKEFFDYVYTAGLFNLNAEYNTDEAIMDGGGWTLKLNYSNGTNKISNGSNARPSTEFNFSDYAFYRLYGEDLFGSLDYSYKYPPSIDVAIHYSLDNMTNVSDGFSGIAPTNYTWRGRTRTGINNFEESKKQNYFDFSSNVQYTMVLWTANFEYKFKLLVVKSYALDGSGEKVILNSKWFKQKEFDIELNRVYIISITYDEGVCEYPVSTKTSE